MRVYCDTSVFGGLFDPEFTVASKAFFEQVLEGRFALITSSIVEEELALAPPAVRKVYSGLAGIIEVVPISDTAIQLRDAYLTAQVVGSKSHKDALHIAVASTSDCRMVVSWNFKHIVHFQKIPVYNAINTVYGLPPLGIFSPSEVIHYDNEEN
ncbi:MAG: type II toxin-antitoxin system VapC family toxin [SAR202 cluster bacterium]|nr:type II toxin-antitoxin system VapC family toxin [SAR202 cluster bacterium]